MGKGKRKIYDSEDPAYIPDLGFLKDIYVAAQQNQAVNSSALDSLVSLCSDSFMALNQTSIENASLTLSLRQHAALMAL
ncbi:hypothetical protein MKW92_045236, partial [Papaver armeniacum]